MLGEEVFGVMGMGKSKGVDDFVFVGENVLDEVVDLEVEVDELFFVKVVDELDFVVEGGEVFPELSLKFVNLNPHLTEFVEVEEGGEGV